MWRRIPSNEAVMWACNVLLCGDVFVLLSCCVVRTILGYVLYIMCVMSCCVLCGLC